MTTHNNNNHNDPRHDHARHTRKGRDCDFTDRETGARRERPLGHLAAVVSHHTRAAMKAALAEAGVSRRDLRLLAVIEREPQTAEALAERRKRRAGHGHLEAHAGHGRNGQRRHGHSGDGHYGDRGHHGGSHKHVHLSDRLARLVEQGLLSRDASGILSITERGAEVRRAAREALAALRERSRVGISDADLETTRRTLAALAKNLAA